MLLTLPFLPSLLFGHAFFGHPDNCVSAARIAPVWPAFVIDEKVAAMLRERDGTDEVYCLDDWDWKPLVALWQRLRSAAGHPGH